MLRCMGNSKQTSQRFIKTSNSELNKEAVYMLKKFNQIFQENLQFYQGSYGTFLMARAEMLR